MALRPPTLTPEDRARSAAFARTVTWCVAQVEHAGMLTPCRARVAAYVDRGLVMPACERHASPASQAEAMRWLRAALRALPEHIARAPAEYRRTVFRQVLHRHVAELRHERKVGLIMWADARRAAAHVGARPRCPGCGCGEGAVCRIVWEGGEATCAPAGGAPGHRVCSGCVTAHDAPAGIEVVIPTGRYGSRNSPAGPFRAPAGLAMRRG